MTPPLVRACAREGDDVRAVELLLGQGHAGGLEERAPDGGLTALMAACKQGNFSCKHAACVLDMVCRVLETGSCRRTHTLILDRNRIGPAGVQRLCELARSFRLSSVNLSCNPIGAESQPMLSQLRKLKVQVTLL
mmetsp:Transcript_3882/g.5775  ORF Transcript_3882/g.5775 Transcript_3882/m.5775 type:complete len:135 (+) Transcript_3882:101-505(+)